MQRSHNSVLNQTYSDFITQGISMLIASRDAENRPVLCRACGCHVADDGALKIFVPAASASQLLDAISESRTVAAVFSEPATHRTIQLKGDDAQVAAFDEAYRSLLNSYADSFAATLAGLGYPDTMARRLLGGDRPDISIVRFTPTEIFDQTPGPGAGEPLNTGQ